MSEKVMRRSQPNSGACRLRPEKRTNADIAGYQFGAIQRLLSQGSSRLYIRLPAEAKLRERSSGLVESDNA